MRNTKGIKMRDVFVMQVIFTMKYIVIHKLYKFRDQFNCRSKDTIGLFYYNSQTI